MTIPPRPDNEYEQGIEVRFIDGTKDWFDPIMPGDLKDEEGVFSIWGLGKMGWQFPSGTIASVKYYDMPIRKA